MYLYLWYFGVALKFIVSGRLIIREWLGRLPCFSAFVFVCTMKSLFLIPAYGSALYGNIVEFLSPWITCLQVAASVEAFILFSGWVPRLRKAGFLMMAVCAVIATGLVKWTTPENKASLAVAATAALERGFGFGIAIFLILAVCFYRFLDQGQPRAAYLHACCLAFLSVTNAIGWQMIQEGVSLVYPTWVMVGGGVLAFAGWLLIVKEVPHAWSLPVSKTPIAETRTLDSVVAQR